MQTVQAELLRCLQQLLVIIIIVIMLLQCINQILSRVTSKDNLFEKVVAEKQPGLFMSV